MPGDTAPLPVPEFRSLLQTPGYITPQPITDTHRLMLWNSVESYPEPTLESGIVLTAMKSLLENEPNSGKRRTIAEKALADLIADELFVELTPQEPSGLSPAKTGFLVISRLGLQVAGNSVRPYLIDPAQHDFYTRRRAYQVHRKANRALRSLTCISELGPTQPEQITNRVDDQLLGINVLTHEARATE